MTKIIVGSGLKILPAISRKKLLLLGKTKYKKKILFPPSFNYQRYRRFGTSQLCFFLVLPLPIFIIWPWASHVILLSCRILLWKLRIFSWLTSMKTLLDKSLCSPFYGLGVDTSLDLLFYNDIFVGVDTFQNSLIIL